MSTTSSTVASTHTMWENPRRPGTCTGSVTPAVATMPVPITEANQLGPKFLSRVSSVVMAEHRCTRVLRWTACGSASTSSSTVGASSIDSTVNALAKMRDEGVRRVWMAQMPSDGDLLTVLAVAMREVDGIEVGSAVLPIQNQHPVLMAQRALTLNKIAGGRFILGLGMTHQVVTEGMWGIPYDKPVRRMREYLDALAAAAGGRVGQRGR